MEPVHRQWTNRSLPQTLQLGVVLLYVNAIFALLALVLSLGAAGLSSLVLFVFAGASGLAGLGIANERRSGYRLGVGVAVLDVAVLLIFLVLFRSFVALLNLVLAAALLALLVHAQSREHARIWFH